MRGVASISTKESHWWEPQWLVRATVGGERDGRLDAARPDSWDVGKLRSSKLSSGAKGEGLVTDDPAFQCTQTDPGEWSDVSA